jgi:NAD(P)-dependent dehydrogenase (short-subunit alcohol dehydrogenase family)
MGRSIENRTILVTGATDGMGRALSERLAGAGATVLLHGRDEARGRAVLEEMRARTGNDALRLYLADFGCLEEVGAMADDILEHEPVLHVLVNNAAVGSMLPGGGERLESRDGHELRFAVNHLAPYLLTRRLLPRLKDSAPARVVNVSSSAQLAIDFDDVMLERSYDGVRAYGQAKLALNMLTLDVAGEFDPRVVAATSFCPGRMATKIIRYVHPDVDDPIDRGV